MGYTLNKAASISKLKEYLRSNTPDLVMGMIHKFQENELRQRFPELNRSDILVMIDEAHRTQYKLLGANLQVALPNAVRVAFTGTPIDKTEKTFGDYIDTYTARQAVSDGVTVEIVYEGRTNLAYVTDKEAMDRQFEDVFSSVDQDARKLILERYTWRAYLEAEEVIRDKAADMLEHYLAHVFPNRFKAQVVAVSRLAAIRYKKALDIHLQNKIREMEQNDPNMEDLAILKRMKVAVVISGTNNDPAEYQPYTDDDQHEKIIASFKLDYEQQNEEGITGDVGILVVQNMLITGFDAPVEQVMYLDNVIREHNLLQAIARVNRVSANKSCGFIIDYVGIARHLREALAIFDQKDQDEILGVVINNSANIDNLKFIHGQVKGFFKNYDVQLNDTDACVDVLSDEEVRDDYIALVRSFNRAIDRVLPDPEALKFVGDLKLCAWISETARNRYRDDKLSIRDASRKIREIVDSYLRSRGVDPKIPPIPIFSEAFKAKIKQNQNPRAVAEEITHAIREHINETYETDPEFYDRLAEKLEKLLAQYKDNWDQLAKELEEVLELLKKGRADENNYGLNPRTELPYLAFLKRELYGSQEISQLAETDLNRLLSTTNDLLEMIHRETQQVDFWENYSAQKRLKSYILTHLLMAFKDNREFIRNRSRVVEQLLEMTMHLNATRKN